MDGDVGVSFRYNTNPFPSFSLLSSYALLLHVTGIRRLATYSIGAAPAKALGFHPLLGSALFPGKGYRRLNFFSYSYTFVFIGTAWVGRHGTLYHLLMSGRMIPRHAFALLFPCFHPAGSWAGKCRTRSRHQRCYSLGAGLQEGDDLRNVMILRGG